MNHAQQAIKELIEQTEKKASLDKATWFEL